MQLTTVNLLIVVRGCKPVGSLKGGDQCTEVFV